MDNFSQSQPQFAGAGQGANVAPAQAQQAGNLFNDPNSFVPQNLRQYNMQGKYYSTQGMDVYGNQTKLYFTLEERNYITQNGITAQEFYNKFQSKLGGNFVQGMPKSASGMNGPSYSTPSSFVPADMRRSHPEYGYIRMAIKDEVGMDKEVYLSNEEMNFVNQNGMDVGTYINVYQAEFNYDKGQMENAQAQAQGMEAQAEMQMERTPSNPQ